MPAVDKLLLEEALLDSPQTRSLLSVFEEDAGTLTDYTNQLLQTMQRVYGAQEEKNEILQAKARPLVPMTSTDFLAAPWRARFVTGTPENPFLQSKGEHLSINCSNASVSGAAWVKMENEMCLATQQLSSQLLAYEKQNFALGKGDEEVISTLQYFANVVNELNVLHTELAKQLADSMVLPLIQFREKDLTEVSTLKDLFLLASNEHDLSMAKYSRLPKKRENEKLKAEIAKEVAGARRKQHLSSLQYYCALNALQYRKRTAMLDPILGYTQGQINFMKKGYEMFSKKMDGFLASVSSMIQRVQGDLDAEAEAMRITQQELLSGSDVMYTPDYDVSSPVINRNLIQKAGYLNMRSKTGLVTTTWERLYFFTQGGNLMCQHRGEVAGGLIQDLDNCSVMAVDCEDRRYCFQITSPNGRSSLILQAEGKREYEEWISAINNISRQIYLSENPEAVAIRLNQTAQQAVTPITSFDRKLENIPQSESIMRTVSHNESLSEQATREPELEQLIAPGTPIQFDIVLPATEFQDQNRGSRRTNPFGESDDKLDNSTDEGLLLQQMFVVRFLGSMAVKTDRTNQVIFEAMRQVLAARAIHNIFRMTESHLMVTSKSIRFIDPQTQVIRISFDLENITQFAAHLENKRLVGFVVCTPEASGDQSLSAYVLESNTEGEKICVAISLGKEIAAAEKDPEALAQLMSSVPLSNDGKFVLLTVQSEDDPDSVSCTEAVESEA